MATRQEFVNGIIQIRENHGMYVGTGNGEMTLLVAGRFYDMEKNYGRRDKDGNPLWYSDTARDYEFLAKCYRNKYDMSKSRACDCSGLPVAVLRDLGVIKPAADYRARDFQRLATTVALGDLQIADLVFDKPKDATHMGVVTAIENGVPMITESRGRDYGVVCRKITDTSFVIGGRLEWFDDDIPVLTRNLRYIKDNLMRGEDVKQCQEQLNRKGFAAGLEDGIFGTKTLDAVIEFQTENDLEIDGVVGQMTWAKLWE